MFVTPQVPNTYLRGALWITYLLNKLIVNVFDLNSDLKLSGKKIMSLSKKVPASVSGWVVEVGGFRYIIQVHSPSVYCIGQYTSYMYR